MIPALDGNAIETELERLRETQLTREHIDEIVRDLGEIVGIEGLQLDETGVAELQVDETVELSLIHLPAFPGIVAAAAMPEGTEEDGIVLRGLLQANMSWALTQGGCFAFVPPRLALCRLIPLAEADSERLDRELAVFVELAQAWQKEIEAQLSGAAGETEAADEQEEGYIGLQV